MSELPLPEDLARWPDDANDLLGVSYGVTPRELRRAYNRLIRIYKPEQFPEQFRRIREAYEYLLRIADLFSSHVETPDASPDEEPQLLPAPQEQSSDDGVSEWLPESPQLEEEASAEDFASSRPRGSADELDELWQLAVTGNPSPAYERLVQLQQQYSGRIEVYLRLYWLLTLSPELDSRRVPADWLVQGLLATGLAGSLRELYREEVADDPAEALGERYGRLLDSPVHAGLLADLIEWRFQAAGRLGRWDVVAEDVRKLRRRFGPGEDQLWLRLLFSLADELAWAEDGAAMDLLEVCRTEIARHEYLASTMSHAFDRFDLLLEASSGWHKLLRQVRIPGSLVRLIPASWCRPFAEVRPLLMEVLAAIAAAPRCWLDHLDDIHEHTPTTLALLGELLDRFEQVRETTPTVRATAKC